MGKSISFHKLKPATIQGINTQQLDLGTKFDRSIVIKVGSCCEWEQWEYKAGWSHHYLSYEDTLTIRGISCNIFLCFPQHFRTLLLFIMLQLWFSMNTGFCKLAVDSHSHTELCLRWELDSFNRNSFWYFAGEDTIQVTESNFQSENFEQKGRNLIVLYGCKI